MQQSFQSNSTEPSNEIKFPTTAETIKQYKSTNSLDYTFRLSASSPTNYQSVNVSPRSWLWAEHSAYSRKSGYCMQHNYCDNPSFRLIQCHALFSLLDDISKFMPDATKPTREKYARWLRLCISRQQLDPVFIFDNA
jgi:hypothetical protein